MSQKNTIYATKIRDELRNSSLNGRELAKKANIPYSALDNVLRGKSSKIEKLDAIAKALGKDLAYFVNSDSAESRYDSDMHYKIIKIIGEFCKTRNINIIKEKMDKLVEIVYPKINKEDPEELIKAQTEAIIEYYLTKT